MYYSTAIRRAMLTLLTALTCSQAIGGVVITGTRLIYPAGQKEITVKLDNNGTRPALVQSWVDSGDVKSSPTNSKSPFVLSPPVFRIDPNKGQTLRLMYTGGALPVNKESVFWLNVLEIPPKADEPVALNVLQMAFRTRIKIFYRPEGLQGKPGDAVEQLNWQLVKGDIGPVLQAHNPKAFHVSLVELKVVVGGQGYVSEDGMVGPGETKTFPLPTLKIMPNGARAQVEFNAINDYGALLPIKKVLAP